MRELLEKVKALPRRVEAIGGQNFSYVQLGELIGLIEAELAKPDEAVGWHCVACHSVGMLHCGDPAECGSMQRTYLQPPRQQDPLSGVDIELGFNESGLSSYLSFMRGVKFAEKAHGIGGEK